MRISTHVGVPGLATAAGGNSAYRQDGPTLDLFFTPVVTDPLKLSTTTDFTLNLDFLQNGYQIAVQYGIWE